MMFLTSRSFVCTRLMDADSYVGKRCVVKNIGNGVAYIKHDNSKPTGLFIGTATRLVSHLAHTANRGKRPIQNTDNLPEGDLLRWPGQRISTSDSHPALQQAGIF